MREELEPILRWRSNRVVHACIALLLLLLALAFIAAYTTHHMGGLMFSVPALLVCLAAVYFVVQSAVTRFVAHPAIRGCLEKQRAAILSFKPDVVVGSSWGGGIATYLMMEGAWCGPTVLLAPAGGIIARKARFMPSEQLHIPSSVGYVHLVHSKLDRIVPVQDTIDLVHRSLQPATAAASHHDDLKGSNHDQDDSGAQEMEELDEAKRSGRVEDKKKKERIKLTVVEDDDHPLSRTMREEHLREAVLEAYTFVHPRRKPPTSAPPSP